MQRYNKQGKPITDIEARELQRNDPNYARIGYDEVGIYEISTIWLGIDHNFFGFRPLIFETMVFLKKRKKNQNSIYEMERYHTLSQAEKGHEKMVEKIKKEIETKEG